MDSEILRGLEMAMWADAYDSRWEQAVEDGVAEKKPYSAQSNLMDVCGEPQCDLKEDVAALYRCIEGDNGVILEKLCERYNWDCNDFGHLLAMQSMGHGVGWWDETREIEPLKLPLIEPLVDVPEIDELYPDDWGM